MAKKAAGTATIERGRLPGEAETYPEFAERAAPANEGPVADHAELIARAAQFTPDVVGELRSRFPFNGVYPGSSLNVKLKLSPESSDSMRKLFLALNRSNTRLASGKHVGSIADVVTWLMEDATRQIEERASA